MSNNIYTVDVKLNCNHKIFGITMNAPLLKVEDEYWCPTCGLQRIVSLEATINKEEENVATTPTS